MLDIEWNYLVDRLFALERDEFLNQLKVSCFLL